MDLRINSEMNYIQLRIDLKIDIAKKGKNESLNTIINSISIHYKIV